MKALLRKDWLVMKAQYKIYLVICMIFCLFGLAPNSSIVSSYSILIASTICINLLQTDETSHFLTYADTTPLSRRMVVGEKYVLTLLIIGSTSVLSFVLQCLSGLVTGEIAVRFHEGLWSFCMYILVGTLMNGLTMPLLYRFGVMKGRLVMLFLYGGIAGLMAGGYIGVVLEKNTGGMVGSLAPVAILALVSLVVLYPLSYKLAVRWYEKREL